MGARNVIAHGAGKDIVVHGSPQTASLTIFSSNWSTWDEQGNAALNVGFGHQSALENPAVGNFRQLPGSPTVNAGSGPGVDPVGPIDIDGDQRVVGGVPDIGGDELTPPPTVFTGGATLIGSTVATINGSVNPNGGFTTRFFQWGPTAAYGKPAGLDAYVASLQSGGNGFAPVPVALKLTGLTTGCERPTRPRRCSGRTRRSGRALSARPIPAAPRPSPDSRVGRSSR
jgi:hypothetical protein